MIYNITFKDPDAVIDCVEEQLKEQLNKQYPELDIFELNALRESRNEKVQKFLSRWIEFGEYLTVEFDDEKGTATVVQQKW